MSARCRWTPAPLHIQSRPQCQGLHISCSSDCVRQCMRRPMPVTSSPSTSSMLTAMLPALPPVLVLPLFATHNTAQEQYSLSHASRGAEMQVVVYAVHSAGCSKTGHAPASEVWHLASKCAHDDYLDSVARLSTMSTHEGPRKAAAGKQDPRFAAVGTDPRFQRFPKKQKRVEIDERFAGESAVCMHARPSVSGVTATQLLCREMFLMRPNTLRLAWPSSPGMFTDPSFQQPSRVDKRGRKVGHCVPDRRLASGLPRAPSCCSGQPLPACAGQAWQSQERHQSFLSAQRPGKLVVG